MFGLALGYEDLIDHDELRHDPVMAVLAGKLGAAVGLRAGGGQEHAEPAGAEPVAADAVSQDQPQWGGDRTLAGRSVPGSASIGPPGQIVLDLDATDDPLHGEQEGRYFNSYYDCYCYLPLYVFCGRHLLAAKLRGADSDGFAGSVEEVTRIVGQIRDRWPKVRILVRGDSGFAARS